MGCVDESLVSSRHNREATLVCLLKFCSTSPIRPADTLYEGAFLKARLSFPEVRHFGLIMFCPEFLDSLESTLDPPIGVSAVAAEVEVPNRNVASQR
jgi:hypothetical protein